MKFHDRLSPADAQTVRVLPVEVPEGARQIRLDLTYDPRTVEDRGVALDLVRQVLARLSTQASAEDVLARFWPLRNLLNIAVFDPRGRFRGRWDRNRPEQRSTALLGEEGSDAGMVDGAMVSGTWRLCLEVHQILTPVEYALSVEFRDEISPAGAEGGPSTRAPWSKTMSEPTAGGRVEWLVGELHVHSEHSDGKQPVREIAQALLETGLDFFALTDHNTTSGLRDLPAGAPALPGLELTTFYGHATCLGLTEFVPWYAGSRVRPFAEIAAEVRARGALVSVAHPFSPPNPLCAGCRWEFPGFSWDDADLLEIWNGDRDEHALINDRALALWDDLLTAGRRIVAVAGSDLHDLEHLKTKRYARTLVQADGRSPERILEGLRAGLAVVTLGPRVRLEAIAGKGPRGIGETAVVRRGERVTVRGAVTGAPRAAETALVIAGRPVPQRHEIEHALEIDAPTWIRAQVRVDGKLAAVTNPIFIDVGD